MAIERLGHYSIRTFDLEASRRFYTEVLGLREGYRPPFPFPGVWLYLSDDDREYGTVHIIGIDQNDPKGLIDYLGDKSRDELRGTGTVDHIGFVAKGLSEMRRKLRDRAVEYRERTVPQLELHQLFLTDPSGVTIELNYSAAEARETG
jgi:catechol 2,3-dioxygenase-like lactoylglutathione lyase family enzyme